MDNYKNTTKNVTLNSLKQLLITVNQELDDYLQRVEFYIEEPNLDYVKKLEQQRSNLKHQIYLRESILSTEDNTHPFINTDKPKTVSNSVIKNQRTTAPTNQDYEKLEKRCNELENLLRGVKSSLVKEKRIRVQQDEKAENARHILARALYETNPSLSSLQWVAHKLNKDPNWGIETDETTRI